MTAVRLGQEAVLRSSSTHQVTGLSSRISNPSTRRNRRVSTNPFLLMSLREPQSQDRPVFLSITVFRVFLRLKDAFCKSAHQHVIGSHGLPAPVEVLNASGELASFRMDSGVWVAGVTAVVSEALIAVATGTLGGFQVFRAIQRFDSYVFLVISSWRRMGIGPIPRMRIMIGW